MHRPDCPQPAGHLISRALAERGVYIQLRRPKGDCRVVGINDCNDDRTYWNKLEKIKETLNADVQNDADKCVVLPVPFFGGLIGISSSCPGYDRSDATTFLKQLRIAVKKRGVRVLFGGSHGEECGFCNEEGITVAQRQWLARDAKMVIMRTAELQQWTAPNDPIQVCVTWHRRYEKAGREHQKTRVIGVRHPLFDELPITTVMQMDDQQVIERVTPHLIDLVAV